ncbi:MAG: hypothetical protein ACREVE_12855 [Gammaproteobacteria bacterium]
MDSHDWMMGYIYVADTAQFKRVGTEGIAIFEGVPLGRCRVRAWHPRHNGGREERSRQISSSGGGIAQIRFEWKLARPAASEQSPKLVQEKPRRLR